MKISPFGSSGPPNQGSGARKPLTTMEKERIIRDKYPDVKKLYEEYRVALILAGGEDLCR